MVVVKSLRALGAAFAVMAMIGLAGCGEEGAGEKAGKKLDKAGEELGKSVDDMKKQLQGK
ncbi:MAG: transport-associated protein [Alphaproteobacteria bacterium]|nr:transport-associated protein [Alphaproteobacteria bacterium]